MYTFKNTERNNFKATVYETKSFLYLIGLRADKNNISTVAIDCFNDLTGMSQNGSKLWDVQSKGEASLTPRKIGKYLYTLFYNFESSIDFHEYIFFMPPLNNSYLIADVGYIYNIKNFKEAQQEKIKSGLIAELERLKQSISDAKVDNFLENVFFVEDRQEASTYVKSVLEYKNKEKKSELFYADIFTEIRDLQAAKKNSYIEGATIKTALDVLKLNRHIEKKQIHMLLVNRLVGTDLFFDNKMPIAFFSEATRRNLDAEDLEDLIQECKSNISKAFFNKNSKREFWQIFERIIESVETAPKIEISEIYNSFEETFLKKLTILDRDSILFLCALIKDGLKK